MKKIVCVEVVLLAALAIALVGPGCEEAEKTESGYGGSWQFTDGETTLSVDLVQDGNAVSGSVTDGERTGYLTASLVELGGGRYRIDFRFDFEGWFITANALLQKGGIEGSWYDSRTGMTSDFSASRD